MKVRFYVLIVLLCLFVFPASVAISQVERDQEASITSSPNPLGSGARALGMGNAFIAVADDATAASWNPGGLMQLETPEVSIVLSDTLRTEDYDFINNPEAYTSERTNTFDINYLSAAYPFAVFGKNMIFSLNYQRLYDLNKELKFNIRTVYESASGTTSDIIESIHYKADGGIKALSPAYAVQITENLSFGFTLNFWLDAFGGRNGWKDEIRIHGEGTFDTNPWITTDIRSNEYDNARGFNFNLGVLWNITEMITLGAVFKSPLELEMNHSLAEQSTSEFPDSDIFTKSKPIVIEDDIDLNFPLSYGVGLSFRLSDEFTVAFDAYRTEWGQYFFRAEDDSKTSPINGRPWDESHLNAATQVHMGAEYLFILEKTVIPVRGGMFYDPEPSEDSTEDFYGISFGTGVSLGNVILDAAYQYRWGREAGNKGVPDTEVDIDQHTFYISAIYHF